MYVWGKSGDKYEGQWHNGLRSGYGSLLETTGAKWEGEWMHGKRHGAGTQRYRTGE